MTLHTTIDPPWDTAADGAVDIPRGLSPLARMARFAGPGLLVSVGYMDPGNWATDLAAGSRYGYALLFVVLASCLAAMVLQTLSLRLGIASGRDLAQITRDRYAPAASTGLWLTAELAIIATDIAEVLGSALAFKLLFGLPLWIGVLVTGLDTLLVLALRGRGFRQLEAIVLALVLTIAVCFAIQLGIARPDGAGILAGLVPSAEVLRDDYALYLAIGILGATVMPHNLYLHSAIVRTRRPAPGNVGKREAMRFATIDIIGALTLATLINGAILILAAATFHVSGNTQVVDIEDAHRLLAPLTGVAIAAPMFAVALLAAGQSATFTGTLAGQVILEGFTRFRLPFWVRRLITRILALVPALAGVLIMGEGSVGKLLVLTQVVLSAQLPFAMYPLLRFTGDRRVMGRFASGRLLRATGWFLFAVVTSANIWLLATLF